ncbi:MAG TPA: hypothetical protein VK177_10800 [Flavobacteriales bacterium]|nr:hypothetical protein [Flavobacteriales bacterium]
MRICLLIPFLIIPLLATSQGRKNTAAKVAEKEQKQFWKQISDSIPEFEHVFKKHQKYRFEIIYGQVNHEPGKLPRIRKFYFGDASQYFYPASCVKLPVALKTLQKLNAIQGDTIGGEWYLQFEDTAICGGNKYPNKSDHFLRVQEPLRAIKAAALCGTKAEEFCKINGIDPDNAIESGAVIIANKQRPFTINEQLSEMLIYSHNGFYNQLFDFSTGEESQFNARVKITTRFIPCIGENVDMTSESVLISGKNATTIRNKPEHIGDYKKNIFSKGLVVGKGVMSGENIIKGPKNFTRHNAMQLETITNALIEVVFPGYLPNGSFYEINEEQRRLLIKYLGMKPSEDRIVSDTAFLRVKDDYTNFLFTGQSHASLPPTMRIVNIVGQSYGFLTDVMYFADEANKIDFFLAARIYVNDDEILNDDKYEYEQIAYPLFEKLGKEIYDYELKRTKSYATNPEWLFQIFR